MKKLMIKKILLQGTKPLDVCYDRERKVAIGRYNAEVFLELPLEIKITGTIKGEVVTQFIL